MPPVFFRSASSTSCTSASSSDESLQVEFENHRGGSFGIKSDRIEGFSAKTETWNGSAWTEAGDTPSGFRGGMATGSYTSGLTGGGDVGGVTAECDTWDGSSWTEIAEFKMQIFS